MKTWININSTEDVDNIIELSIENPQIIYKDSVTCGISQYAKERLSLGNDLLKDKADFNYLDLLANRDVSNYITKALDVIHQSPQIIVLKNKEVIYTVTHHSIDPQSIANHL